MKGFQRIECLSCLYFGCEI